MFATESVSVYRNRKTRDYRIQPFGRLPNGSSQPFGAEAKVTAHTPTDVFLKLILSNLEKNRSQKYERHLAPKIAEAEFQREIEEDQLITVQRRSEGFRLIPSRRMGNGFGSIDDMIQVYRPEEFLRRGGEIIEQLFREIP